MPTDPPDDLDLEPIHRGRNTPILIGVVVVAVAGAAAYAVQHQMTGSRRADALTRTSTAWNALRRCLVGDQLGPRQRPSRLARQIELGLSHAITDLPPDQRRNEWPVRCASHASVMTHALFDAASEDRNHQLLATLASRAASALEEGSLRTAEQDRLTYLDEIFQVADMAHLPPGAPSTGPLPPAAAHPLEPNRLTPLFAEEGAADVVQSDPIAGRRLRVVLGRGTPSLCVSPAGDTALGRIECAHTGPHTALATSDDGTPNPITEGGVARRTYIDGQGRTYVLMPPAPITTLPPLGSTEPPWVVTLGDHARSVPWPFVATDRIAEPWWVGTNVLVAAVDRTPTDAGVASDAGTQAGRPAQLYVADLREAVTSPVFTAVGPLVPMGTDVPVRACHVGDRIAVVIAGAGDRASVTFVDDAAHATRPVPVEAPARATLTCTDHDATLTWIETSPHRWVRQTRCNGDACTDAHGAFPQWEGDGLPVATDLAGRVLLLASPGPGHGLRMLLAPIDQLVTADSVVVLDDAAHRGLDLAPALDVFVRGDAAAVLASTAREPFLTYAIRIDARGGFTELRHAGSLDP